MTERPFLSWLFFLIGSATTAAVMMVGCSSTPTSATGCTSGETVSCTCPGGGSGTAMCGNPTCNCGETSEDAGASGVDATPEASSLDTPGDATHQDEKSAPSSVYAVCAAQGSFGWPCYATTSGPDPSECTDPNFPDCFVGGQSSWCSVSCATFGVCPGDDQDAGDAGCTPAACNARGYCK